MSFYYSSNQGGFMSNVPPVTKNLILINIFVFVATLINENFIVTNFALFYPASRFFRFWQPVTHLFVHGGFWHILFNMYTLYIFGVVVERIIGSKKFLVFYFICGLGAAALHMGVQAAEAASLANGIALGSQQAVANYAMILRTPTVGASGAIYGVLLAYAMLFPESRLTLIFPPVTLSAKWMVIIFAAIEVVTGTMGTADGIAHFAHLGGMIFGWLMIFIWKKKGTLFDRNSYL